MKLIDRVDAFVSWRSALDADHGFVPTMGALHAGHLALVRAARRAHHHVSASIFVNPLQFGPHEGYHHYPRPRERDLALLRDEGVDAVFAPSMEEMYPARFATAVVVHGPLVERLEGQSRPGHFQGVATVVAKLLAVARPTTAYFGQKDAQQVLVVQRLTRDLNLGVQIAVVPTVRESNGLALSSRNRYLNEQERRAAPTIFRALSAAASGFDAGERSAVRLRERAEAVLKAEPLLQLDYLSVSGVPDLQELTIVEQGALVAVACRIGPTRLIDNVLLGTARLDEDVRAAADSR